MINPLKISWRLPAFLLIAAFLSTVCCLAANPSALIFSFGSAKPEPGYIQILPTNAFSTTLGYGFEASSNTTLIEHPRSLTSAEPFYFSARVPGEGNYRVTVTLGDASTESTTTIKAELRRLMIENLHTAPGEFKTASFIVNVRTPQIPAVAGIPAGQVKLKAPRETTQEAWAWDDLLTLEFTGNHPALARLKITRAAVPTVFLIGDSTVCDQSLEPYASWGQMLPRFFKPEVAIANHAESGETYRDSLARRRLDKILSAMQPGDYLLMQFGHNDQKQIAAGKGGPFTTYKAELKQHVEGVRARGGIPVVISPMERRNFDGQGHIVPSLTDYAEAARQSAKELGVAFIDLNAMSIPFYDALGKDRAYLAFAGTGTNRDATHHDNYGAYELAKCIVQGIRDNQLPLAKFIADDFKTFDPAHPDPVDSFAVPASPRFTNQRPLGD